MFEKKSIVDYLKQYNLFTDSEINEFISLATISTIKKGDFFIKQDEICTTLSFVNFGIFRSFYYSNNDEEITYCFTFPNTLLVAYSSFITQNKSEENLQALTDSEIISILTRPVDNESCTCTRISLFEVNKIVAKTPPKDTLEILAAPPNKLVPRRVT